jgi:hypothetical protein
MLPSCGCVPPDEDDLALPWIRECDYHATMRKNLHIAVGALADIAFSDDVTLLLARKKSKRIYEEITFPTPPATDPKLIAAAAYQHASDSTQCAYGGSGYVATSEIKPIGYVSEWFLGLPPESRDSGSLAKSPSIYHCVPVFVKSGK